VKLWLVFALGAGPEWDRHVNDYLNAQAMRLR
jgi:hypothetical protein